MICELDTPIYFQLIDTFEIKILSVIESQTVI